MMEALAELLQIPVQLSIPTSFCGDDKNFVDHLLGDQLGWEHPVSRLCTTMTQSITSFGSNAFILSFLDLTGSLPTDGDWKINISLEETDLVLVKHTKSQFVKKKNFSIEWSLDLWMRLDTKTISMDVAELHLREENCSFPDEETRKIVSDRIKALQAR